MCKLHQNSKKNVMMDVLPVDICCKISEYFGCLKCADLKEREDEFFKRITVGVMPRIEKQILFISNFECRVFNNFLWGNAVKEMKKEIDLIFNNQKFREKYFNCKMLLQATKSWAKKDIHIVKSIHDNINDVSGLRRLISEFIEDRYYEFRNIDFTMFSILRCLIIGYVYYICENYINYMCKKEIDKFIKDVFP